MYYIYRYTYRGEVIYIGKTSRSLSLRINEHKRESKFLPYLAESEIDYFDVPTSVEMDIAEKYYINVYSPKLNVTDMCGAIFQFQLPEPKWKSYDENRWHENLYANKKQQTQEQDAATQVLRSKLSELERECMLLENFSALLELIFETYISGDVCREGRDVFYRWDMDAYPLPDAVCINGTYFGCYTVSSKCGCGYWENKIPAKSVAVFLEHGREYVTTEYQKIRGQILDLEYELERIS